MPLSQTRPALFYSVSSPPRPDGTSAPGVVFLNGLGGLREAWLAQVRHLAPHCRVLTYNQRGIGGSEVLDEDVDMTDFARDLAALLDEVGMARASLVGISFGGRVAQEMALILPERVDRLVLVATSCGGPHHAPGDPRARAALRSADRLPAEVWMRDLIPALFGDRFRAAHTDRLDRLARLWARHPPDPVGLARQWQAYDAFDRWADLPGLSAPTLVIHGTEDRMSPVSNARVLAARIPGARLHLLDGVGHSPNVEAADELNAALLDFLAPGPGAPGSHP